MKSAVVENLGVSAAYDVLFHYLIVSLDLANDKVDGVSDVLEEFLDEVVFVANVVSKPFTFCFVLEERVHYLVSGCKVQDFSGCAVSNRFDW